MYMRCVLRWTLVFCHTYTQRSEHLEMAIQKLGAIDADSKREKGAGCESVS